MEFSAGAGVGHVVREEGKRVSWGWIVKGLKCHPKKFAFHPVENDESLELFKQDIYVWKESSSHP